MISQKLLPAAFDSRHARQIGRQPQVLQSPGQLALGATLLCSQGPQMRTNKIFRSFVWHIFSGCGRGSLQATAAQALGCFQAERQSLTAFVGWARSSTLERRTGAPRRSKSRKSLTRVDFILQRAFRLRHLAFWHGRCAVRQVERRVLQWKRSPVRGRLREHASKVFHKPALLQDRR